MVQLEKKSHRVNISRYKLWLYQKSKAVAAKPECNELSKVAFHLLMNVTFCS